MNTDRFLEKIIMEQLLPGKVQVLYGARRVGKTFLLKKIIEKTKLSYLWLNGESLDDTRLLEERSVLNLKRLFANIELLVIDEAQSIEKIGLILKLIVDEIPTLKIIASGSSAFDLANKLGEPLVGRAYWYVLFPFAQMELKTQENLIEIRNKLSERMIYGSYPEVYNLQSLKEKEEYLRDIVSAYLLKDILSFEGIRNSSKIYDLLKLIAYQIGKEVSLSELGQQLSMSKNTVEKYLNLLEKVFILKRIGGYSNNLRKEISKSSRWYFWDNGIRNAVINDFRTPAFRVDLGELWENYLMTERLKKNRYEKNNKEVFFWRTYDQQEIDLIEVENQQIDAFEFKWGDKKAKIPVGFALAYPDASFQVINQSNYLDFIE